MSKGIAGIEGGHEKSRMALPASKATEAQGKEASKAMEKVPKASKAMMEVVALNP